MTWKFQNLVYSILQQLCIEKFCDSTATSSAILHPFVRLTVVLNLSNLFKKCDSWHGLQLDRYLQSCIILFDQGPNILALKVIKVTFANIHVRLDKTWHDKKVSKHDIWLINYFWRILRHYMCFDNSAFSVSKLNTVNTGK